MVKIYIASSWKNAEIVRTLADMLRNDGHSIFDFTDPNNRADELDSFVFSVIEWKKHSGKDPEQIDWKDFLTWEPTKRAFNSDKAGIDWADVLVLLHPSGRSSHLEAGYAVGSGKPLFIFGDLPLGEFDAMYGFAADCFRTDELNELREILNYIGET